MKNLLQILFSCVLFLGLQHTAWAQTEEHSIVVVGHPDTSSFPTLKVTIQMSNNDQPLEADFKLFDDDRTVIETFRLEAKAGEEAPTSGNLIFFLIDASSYPENIPLENFKRAVIESIDDFVTEADLINVGFFNKPKGDTRVLQLLDADFSRNFSQLTDQIRTRITSALEDSVKTNYAFKAIKEAIQTISNNFDEGRRLLIVLSGAPDNQDKSFTSDDLIKLADDQNISIHTINFKIDERFNPDLFERLSIGTNGKSEITRNFSDIKQTIGGILESRAQSQSDAIQQYELIFSVNVPQDGQSHEYTINYKEEPPLTLTYTAPGEAGSVSSGGFLNDYFWWIMILFLGAILGAGYWYANEIKIRRQEEEEANAEFLEQQEEEKKRLQQEKNRAVEELKEKNIRLEEQLRAKEQELLRKQEEALNQPPPIPAAPEKRDLKNTIISGGGAAPVFKVASAGMSKNFSLNKPLMTIGRAANNDIVIPEQTVSSKHATISIQKGSFFLNDLGSTNGTFINGTRIESKMLKSGDLIKLGAAQCKFEI